MWAPVRRLLQLLLRGAGPIPQHVAFVMDGNRRFAEQAHMQRIEGHSAGYRKMVEVLRWCLELGVATISVYAFSIDNFGRSAAEVADLMRLAEEKYLELCADPTMRQWRVALRVVGDLGRAPSSVQAAAARLMAASAEQAGPHPAAVVNIAFAYTSTQELEASVGELRCGLADSQLLPSDVTPWLLHRCMHMGASPPVDLLVRTSGAARLSDFMLWQASAAHLQILPVLWPEFGFADLARCMVAWQRAAPAVQQLRADAEAAAGLAQPAWLRRTNSSVSDGGQLGGTGEQLLPLQGGGPLGDPAAAAKSGGDAGTIHVLASGVGADASAAVAAAPAAAGAAAGAGSPGPGSPLGLLAGSGGWGSFDQLTRAESTLSSISEHAEVRAPHPLSSARVQSFLRAREERQAAWVAEHQQRQQSAALPAG